MIDLPSTAFLGLGLMGSQQAFRLVKAGVPLTVWNRTEEKTRSLAKAGAHVALSAADAVKKADVVILMVQDGSIVEQVLAAILETLKPGVIVIDMSSIRPEEAQRHASLLAERGVMHLDAPVSGGPSGAEAGSLAIMVGGDQEPFDHVLPLLQIMGRPVRVGPHGTGQLTKLANQMIVGATIVSIAEAFMFAAKGGADPDKVRKALRGGFAESRILELHGQRMIERDFSTKSRSETQLKDLRNALITAQNIGVCELPATALSAELFQSLISHFGDLDHSAALVELERRNKVNIKN
ncbi:NAD(P)-dependent oxidoreductase [Brucella intermedia]|uniref:NAD(P)-dependent oxidoreductase n=1 Tax=Brucella intermedia TaxID=94625 RepID=UPI00224A73F4|nr:NAD(P)-dependent oxidoreductase [Brucella intermedia]